MMLLNNIPSEGKQSTLESIANSLESIGNFIVWFTYYLFHPIEALSKVWSFIVSVIYPVTVIAIVILILYMIVTGDKKYNRWISFIFLSYLLIKSFNTFM